MNAEKIKTIIRDSVQEVLSSDGAIKKGKPMLSMRDLASLTDIPTRTMKAYEAEGRFETSTIMGVELVDVKAFRQWCLDNLRGKRKADVLGRLDAYINQFQKQDG